MMRQTAFQLNGSDKSTYNCCCFYVEKSQAKWNKEYRALTSAEFFC